MHTPDSYLNLPEAVNIIIQNPVFNMPIRIRDDKPQVPRAAVGTGDSIDDLTYLHPVHRFSIAHLIISFAWHQPSKKAYAGSEGVLDNEPNYS